MPTPPLPVLHSLISVLGLPVPQPPSLRAVPPTLLLLLLEALLGRRLDVPRAIRTPRSYDDEVELCKVVLGTIAGDVLALDLTVVDPLRVATGGEVDVAVVIMSLAVIARRKGLALRLPTPVDDEDEAGYGSGSTSRSTVFEASGYSGSDSGSRLIDLDDGDISLSMHTPLQPMRALLPHLPPPTTPSSLSSASPAPSHFSDTSPGALPLDPEMYRTPPLAPAIALPASPRTPPPRPSPGNSAHLRLAYALERFDLVSSPEETRMHSLRSGSGSGSGHSGWRGHSSNDGREYSSRSGLSARSALSTHSVRSACSNSRSRSRSHSASYSPAFSLDTFSSPRGNSPNDTPPPRSSRSPPSPQSPPPPRYPQPSTRYRTVLEHMIEEFGLEPR